MAGEYRLGKKLGEGGYGAVYAAEHPLLKRRAAVKVLHRASGADSDAVLRFISEARAANQIRSRYMVDIFSFGKLADGRHFYVMDLLEGEPLDRHIERVKRLAVPDALKLLRAIAEALDAAHATGIVHRDLKPQNIFLVWEPNGETVPKLLDFGMAKLMGQSTVQTASGALIGTPLYMSPEQALGRKVDARADIYSLGLLCHELLTGERAVRGKTAVEVLAGHLTIAPPRASQVLPELSSELDAPISHMLEKDPKGRPATAGEAIAELKRAAEKAGHAVGPELPHLTPPPPPPPGQEDDAVAATIAEMRSEAGIEREAVRSGDTTRRGFALSWSMMALLVAIGAGATYLVTRESADSARPSASAPAEISTPAVQLEPSAATPASTAAEPRPPVDLTVQGAPRGATILFDGKPIGETPGPVQVPFGEASVQLVITAAGHEPGKVTFVPNQAHSAAVTMKKRTPGAGQREGIPRDLENPF
jgi:serine/threonine-protein kinase